MGRQSNRNGKAASSRRTPPKSIGNEKGPAGRVPWRTGRVTKSHGKGKGAAGNWILIGDAVEMW